MNYDDPYTAYYLNQAGSGIGQVYSGSSSQRGHGVGNFLSGIFRSFLPLFKSGAKSVRNELLKTGANVLNDIAVHKTSPKESFRKRSREAGQTLASKLHNKVSTMTGEGYKRRKLNSGSHLHSRVGPRKIKRKQGKKKPKRKVKKVKVHKPNIRDIFT